MPGNVADNTMAPRLHDAVDPSRRMIGDKAYDADSLLRWPETRGAEAIIPSNAHERLPWPAVRSREPTTRRPSGSCLHSNERKALRGRPSPSLGARFGAP